MGKPKFLNRRKRNNKYIHDYTPYFNFKEIVHEIYDQKSINEILFNTTIKQVIEEYISLKKKGSLFVGRCPFCKVLTNNNEHFVVSEKRKRYKCFECGVGGTNGISFLMRIHNIPFTKAIQYVNNHFHKFKFKLKIIERKVITKGIDFRGEEFPF